jgi:precorrin-2 dehydrogenase/sirohydrochlorin ferrochelatase
MHWYPMMVRLAGKRCVIVGGGKVAERKAAALLEAGGAAERGAASLPETAQASPSSRVEVVVISPHVTERLAAWASSGRIAWVRREYQTGDLDGAFLVMAAANVGAVNAQVAEDAGAAGILTNIADEPDLSGFIVPSVVRRGKLTLAVSTAGASPSLARRIREELEEAYGQEYEVYLDALAELRAFVRQRVEDDGTRQRMYKGMLEWDLLGPIRRGEFPEFRERLLAELGQAPTLETVERWTRMLKPHVGTE